MTKVFSPDAMRGDLTRLLANLNINTGQTLVQPFLIRLEAVANAARSNYQLDILSNPGSDRPGEIKLNRNDAFGLIGMRLGITRQDTSTTPAQYANFPTFYAPDPNYHSGAPAGQVKEFVSLETIYNSSISLKSQKVDRLSNLHTGLLRHVPERPYVLAAASGQTNAEWPQQSIGVDQFFRVMPNPVLSGQDDNKVELILGSGDIESIEGTADSAGVAVNTRNVIVVELFGYLMVDAAKSALAWDHF